jgi:uncharacterized protein (TIGR02117 family)
MALGVAIAPVFLYLLAALVLALWPVNRHAVAVDDGIELFLVSNGVHVDLAIPVDVGDIDWGRFLQPAQFSRPIEAPAYLTFGWGERRFFLETPTWADLEASVAIPATLWPTPAALRVTRLSGPPALSERVRSARVSRSGYDALERHISSGFRLTADGHPILIDHRSNSRNSLFFEATGSYHAFETCNSWTNRGLQVAGLRTASWAPFEASIFWHFDVDRRP